MKKFSRIAALLMIFCLVLSTAAFAATGPRGEEETAEDGPGWVKGCRLMPFAPGTEFGVVTLDDVAWDSGDYSGTPSTDKIPASMPHFDTPKEIPLLVLVLEFSNIDYDDSYDWSSHIFKGKYSLAQYYKDMSFNQFAFTPAKETSAYNVDGNHNSKDAANDGIVHITLSTPHYDWYGDDEMANYVSALVDALGKADKYVDFSAFDKNGDGELTNDEFALSVVVAGYEGAYGTYPSYGADYYLWSFAWNLASGWYFYFGGEDMANDPSVTEDEFYQALYDFLPDPDGVYVSDYITIPEELIPGEQEPISVLAHELGHYLGLPDLYDTDYDTSATWGWYDVGYLSVMCSGSWGWDKENGQYIPAAFDAWSRSVLGWVKPETVSEGVYDVVSDQSDYNVLQVETGVDGEYYLLENREYKGWDTVLNLTSDDIRSYYAYADHAPNGGIICWHIDDNAYYEYDPSNEVNNTYHRPSIMPLYPEETANGGTTFIGEIGYDSTAEPFFTKKIWDSRYLAELGEWLDFPVYDGSDDPAERTLSGVKMKVLSDSTNTVTVLFGENAETDNKIVRLAGANRYETALAAAEHLKDGKFANVIIASGKDFPDALSATYLAYVKDAPILLVGTPDSITKVTKYINENLAEGGTVYIVGGTGAVDKSVDGKINGTVKRFAGANRYATNIEVLKEAGVEGKEVLIASGKGYADALSASAAGRPILLVGNALTGDQRDYLAANAPTCAANSYIVGGTGAVSDAVEKDLKNFFKGEMKRFGGKNRYETSEMVANEFFKGELDTMVIASGKAFPDGLSGGPVATNYGAPLLLVTDGVTSHARKIFRNQGMTTLVVMGGTGAVSKAIAEDIAAPAKEK
ncbi:MAG: cell wall-binding repeat-containing protein [Firmicutes bacterium]|nr:cell wall-binding repeat-containing protein [Bacillota bacterium]